LSFGLIDGADLQDLLGVGRTGGSGVKGDIRRAPEPGLVWVRLVGAVRGRMVADAMMCPDPSERPGQAGASLFPKLSDDAIPDSLTLLTGASRQEPHVAVVSAHDDLLASESDHMNVRHQAVGREVSREGGIDASPLPALRCVEQGEAVG
jgi:hypothetical protein